MNQDELREADARYGKLNHEYDDGFDAGFEAGKPKWIPVSSQTPPINEPVLISWRAFHGERQIFVDCGRLNSDEKWESDRTDGYNEPIYLEDEGDVLAWMFPEPYTEGE